MCVFMYSGSVVRFVYSFMFDNQVQWLGLCMHLCSIIRFSIHIQVCVCSCIQVQWLGFNIHLCSIIRFSIHIQVCVCSCIQVQWSALSIHLCSIVPTPQLPKFMYGHSCSVLRFGYSGLSIQVWFKPTEPVVVFGVFRLSIQVWAFMCGNSGSVFRLVFAYSHSHSGIQVQ